MTTMTRTARANRTFGEGLYDTGDQINTNDFRVNTGQPDLDAEYYDQVGCHLEYEARAAAATATSLGGQPAAKRPGLRGELTIDQFNFLIHDAIITIHNPATGGHRTFKVETLRGDWNPGKRVVSLLDGPDNAASYKRFGFVDEFGIKVWRRFAALAGQDQTVWEKYALMIESPKRFRDRGLEYMISGKCRRCGLPLTTPRSVTLGIGPTCEKKEGVA